MATAVTIIQVGKLGHGATAASQGPWSKTRPEFWLSPLLSLLDITSGKGVPATFAQRWKSLMAGEGAAGDGQSGAGGGRREWELPHWGCQPHAALPTAPSNPEALQAGKLAGQRERSQGLAFSLAQPALLSLLKCCCLPSHAGRRAGTRAPASSLRGACRRQP